ncbi:MAG: hypothetical protein KIT33_09480 [Candidatus Kapabacteria bacterium]|nr:hypothetical protein [Ignavibacteriota bacterium]MCW5885188.1 hypothetical protein [Candidatus Kapabacteria bacterium]
MNKSIVIKSVIITTAIFILIVSISESKTFTNFSVSGGIALPSSEVNNIFNSNRINTADTNTPFLNFVRPESQSGYSLSGKLSFELTESAHFFGGFGLSGFSKQQFDLENPNGEHNGNLEIKTNIYSINAGVHYYLTDNSLFIYTISNLSYNFIASSLTTIESPTSLRIENNPTDSRLGFSLGIGLELPLSELSLIIESKYTNLNYIGKVSGENIKSLIQIEFGLRF